MRSHDKRSFWQRIRRPFRWCRIALWSLLLLLLSSFLYLNVIGVPDFLKARLVAELRSRGIDLQFSRLRWRWFQGLVAESVQVGGTKRAESPVLSVAEVAVKLDPPQLRKFRFRVASLGLRHGRLTVPLSSADEPTPPLIVNDIMTELRLLPNDRWELEHFHASCLGARLNVTGTLTNASAIRQWRAKTSTQPTPGRWRQHFIRTLKLGEQIHFSQPPQITLALRGDARNPAGVRADLSVTAHGAESPWGKFDKLLLVAKFNHASPTNDLVQSELNCQIDAARTPWANAALSRLEVLWTQALTNPLPTDVTWRWAFSDVVLPWGKVPEVHFSGRTTPSSGDPNLLKTQLVLDCGVFRSEWVECSSNRLTAELVHTPDHASPDQAELQWTVVQPRSRWGDLSRLQVSGHLERAPAGSPRLADPTWAWWAALEPFHVNWTAQADGIAVTNVFVDTVRLEGRWRAPDLVIDQAHAELYDRQANASARVHVGTRAVQSRLSFDFDVHRIQGLLTPASQRWLRQFTWKAPPAVEAEATLTLPPWDAAPDWRGEVLPTVRLNGQVEGRDAAFRGVPVAFATSHFSYSNFVWYLPDFVATGPEGRVEFIHSSDNRTQDYYFKISSRFDPRALKPLFENKATEAFDYFQFTEPPVVEGEVRGRWRQPELMGVTAQVNAANFTFRGEPVSELIAGIHYTNGLILATAPRIRSGAESVSADLVGFELDTSTLFLTNGIGAMEPARIARAIGPKVARTLSPYVFKNPPEARVNGFVEVRRARQAHLQFDLAGGPFTYWKFNVPQIAGTVLWHDETVTITNLAASFYNGKLEGDLFFDISGDHNADFRFDGRVTDADLHLLMSDLSSPTNKLEGTLGGRLTITQANTDDWKSWNGFGNVQLRDGFLWGIPVFGLFSDLLDVMIPGLGNSRVSGGTATFTLTNSVIHTDDMEIHASTMRLAYRGTIDFDSHVDARVEAQILRDAWIVGPLVSLVFSPLTKLFEYKVTGTLHEPKTEPLYIPKPLLFPLQPFRTLKELFSEENPDQPPPELPKPQEPQR